MTTVLSIGGNDATPDIMLIGGNNATPWRLVRCTCYQGWQSVLPPPPCPIHGPFPCLAYGTPVTLTLTTTNASEPEDAPEARPDGEAMRKEEV